MCPLARAVRVGWIVWTVLIGDWAVQEGIVQAMAVSLFLMVHWPLHVHSSGPLLYFHACFSHAPFLPPAPSLSPFPSLERLIDPSVSLLPTPHPDLPPLAPNPVTSSPARHRSAPTASAAAPRSPLETHPSPTPLSRDRWTSAPMENVEAGRDQGCIGCGSALVARERHAVGVETNGWRWGGYRV